MNIPISEHMVISLEDAMILGRMKGVVINKNCVVGVCFSLKNDEGIPLHERDRVFGKYIQVPVREVEFGPDACMLKKVLSTSVFPGNEQMIQVGMKVFDCSGKLLGIVTSIYVDEEYDIKGIYAGEAYIDKEDMLNIGDVVLVLGYRNAHKESTLPETETISCEPSDDKEVSEEIKLDSEDIFYQMTENDWTEVEPKYQYLLNKNLLKDITIADKKYPKGSRIDVELVNTSIKSNCLLSLIMNAED